MGIIREGYSDYCVIRKFVTSIFNRHHPTDLQDDNFFDLDHLNFSKAIGKYVSKADKAGDYTLYGVYAGELRRQIIDILHGSLSIFADYKGDWPSSQDLLILSTDTEKVLKRKHNYFRDWSYTLSGVVWMAVEEFYSRMTDIGYDYENLPLILPLILFPSSEILVAACMYDFRKENFRVMEAKPLLKQKVYETESIPTAIQSGKLEEVLSLFLVPDALKDIYKEIPEVRKFMQIMSFN